MRAASREAHEWIDGFLFVANRPILDLLNTKPVLGDRPTELLPDIHALERWLIASGTVTSAQAKATLRSWRHSAEAAAFLEEIVAFREKLREAVLRMEGGLAPAEAFLAEVNSRLTRHPLPALLRKRKGRVIRETSIDLRRPADLWAPIIDATAELLAETDLSRVRKCESCVIHFLDTSKKGSRRWCSMNICGNKLKVAAYQRRKRRAGSKFLSLCLLLLAAAISASGQTSAQLAGPALVAPDWCRALPRPEYKTLERIPVDDSWFEVYRVAPGVFAIYEPHQWEETLDYVIEGKTSALLIDTGMGIGNLKRLVTTLTPLPIIVVNSHTHADHTGNNWQFSTVYNLDSDYSRRNALGSREIRSEIEPGKICGALPAEFDPAAYATRPWKTTRWLHDGDRIDLGGRTLQVLATPGHAPDSICLFDQANGLLFTGDTYYPGPVYVFSPGSDPVAYQQSVDRLASLAPKVRTVLGGHNMPVAPGSILTELAREFDAIRAGKLRGTPAGGGITQYKGARITFLVRTTP